MIVIAKMIGIVWIGFWIGLVVLMLPVYFLRRKKNLDDEKNTLKSLIIKAFFAGGVWAMFFGSGLLAMYLDEMKGIYR